MNIVKFKYQNSFFNSWIRGVLCLFVEQKGYPALLYFCDFYFPMLLAINHHYLILSFSKRNVLLNLRISS